MTLWVTVALITSISSLAQVSIPPQAGNQVVVTADVQVSFDTTSKLYTYRYAFANAGNSRQEIWFLAIAPSGDLKPTIVNPISPAGWTFIIHEDRSMMSWAATGGIAPDAVPDGNVAPSPYQIKPGQSLGGFSLQSPQPPDAAILHAQGFTKIPAAVDAGDLDGVVVDFSDDSYIATTTAPKGPLVTAGSGAGSVDGFFVLVNPKNNGVYQSSSITALVKFSLNGESVNRSSFNITLNDQDVTSRFQVSGADLSATFQIGAELQNDQNVFRAMVSGVDPASGTMKFKMSRVSFFMNTLGKTDVNGDGAVNCLDLAIVRASFGRRTGQPGFDPRADINKDGLVDIRDQSSVARAVPVGTSCN